MYVKLLTVKHSQDAAGCFHCWSFGHSIVLFHDYNPASISLALFLFLPAGYWAFFCFVLCQLHGKSRTGVDALEEHPLIRRVTPHRKVIRTLKFTKGRADMPQSHRSLMWAKTVTATASVQSVIIIIIDNFCIAQFSGVPKLTHSRAVL